MSARLTSERRRTFEWMLIVIVLGMACAAFQLGAHKLVLLNLFYLPIILSGYFLGRTSACLLAVLCALAVTIATALDPFGLAAEFSPILGGLALAVWAAVLAMAAILVGTLCDERADTVDQLHEAYVGVVEVLSKYLQGAHPTTKARAVRIAELTQAVGEDMRLSRKEIDDIRVGAMLYDLGNVEITTKLITKAVDTLETSPLSADRHTFAGMDLVHSLGSVLHGAVPLLLGQDDDVSSCLASDDDLQCRDIPLGAKIIQSVRAFDALAGGASGEAKTTTQHALDELRKDPSHAHDENILRAIERVVKRTARAPAMEPSYA